VRDAEVIPGNRGKKVAGQGLLWRERDRMHQTVEAVQCLPSSANSASICSSLPTSHGNTRLEPNSLANS